MWECECESNCDLPTTKGAPSSKESYKWKLIEQNIISLCISFFSVLPYFKVIFNMQVVFMGITPDMLPNRIYINLKSELTLENKQ